MGHTGIKYLGNKPDHGELVLRLPGWELYRMKKHVEGFANYKLISTIKRDKANYYLSFNISNRAMVSHRDLRSLKLSHEATCKKIIGYLVKEA